MGQNYQINEFGEIVQEDYFYFFKSAKGDGVKILPSNRKVWKILLLSIITLGIYGIVFWLSMSKETNVACKEDGKHTRGFWGIVGLSIITLGIYGIVWMYQWLNREYAYLQRHDHNGVISGGKYLSYFLILIILSCLQVFLGYVGLPAESSAFLSIIQLILAICLLADYVQQHNIVCRIHNDINNLVKKN